MPVNHASNNYSRYGDTIGYLADDGASRAQGGRGDAGAGVAVDLLGC